MRACACADVCVCAIVHGVRACVKVRVPRVFGGGGTVAGEQTRDSSGSQAVRVGEGVEGWKRTGGDARARSRGAGQYGARAVALGCPGRDGAPRAVMSPPRAGEQAVMPGVKSTPGKQAEGDARAEPPPPT